MVKYRINSFIIIIEVIILGLISRRVTFIPMLFGDFLWATMIYFIIKFIFINSKLWLRSFFCLLICYLVEFSQLCQFGLLINIRSTTLGKLALGQGFLWSDIFAYTFAIVLVTISQIKIININENREGMR